MKQISFYKLSGLVMNVLLLAFVITSCTRKTTEVGQNASSEEFATAKAGSKPSTYPEVPLIMTVVDAGNKITSDNGNPYINDVDNVRVVFDQYGNFMLAGASNNPHVLQPRFLKYDFSDPVAGYAARPNIEQGKFISSGETTTSTNSTPPQNLAFGATRCIGMTAGIITIANGVLNFHRLPYDDTDEGANPTAYVYVTRIDNDHWVITPVPPTSAGCSSVSNVGSLRINGVLTGKYNMPFKFLLERK
jgi:hypothetical protein